MTPEYEAYLCYLDTDHWKQLRRSKIKQVGRFCQNCRSKEILHVHHIHYRNYFDCTVDDLAVLCAVCHDTLHVALKRAGKEPDDFELDGISALITAYRQTPESHKRDAKIQERKLKRLSVRRVFKHRKKEFNTIVERVRRKQYTDASIEQCREQLKALFQSLPELPKPKPIKVHAPVNLTEILCHYSAAELTPF